MLQQTQVKTVLERFYFPFLEAFPTLEALAEAKETDVLKAWEGLGYYSRARNLHKAAKICAPSLPDNYDGLVALPGIGRNTASAICAFAYHKPYPVMEANLKRVLCRFFALQEPGDAVLWEKAHELLDEAYVFDYNQAMMDIGAMVCVPKSPACDACPLASQCRGKTDPHAYGVKRPKKEIPTRHYHTVVLECQGQWMVVKRQTTFLHGMHSFLELSEEEFEQVSVQSPLKIGVVSQQYSHFIAQSEVYYHQVESLGNSFNELVHDKEWSWLDRQDILDQTLSQPLSRIDQKIVGLIKNII
jgi:A/G-specific adenine glycosylase